MNGIDYKLNVRELLEKEHIEVPFELPSFNLGVVFDGEEVKIRIEYDVEQIEQLGLKLEDLEKGDIEILIMQIAIALKRFEKTYEKQVKDLMSKAQL